MAITKDGEVWVADADVGLIEELAEPMVGTKGGGMRAEGRPNALVANPRRAIFYTATDVDLASEPSKGGAQWDDWGRGGTSALAISPNGKILYVASRDSMDRGIVTPFSAASGHAAGRPVRVGMGVGVGEPVAMTTSPDGRKLYVASEFDDSITVVNTVDWRLESVISLQGTPDALAVSPDGAWLYIADLSHDSVVAIDIATGSKGPVMRVGRRPVALAISPDGRTLYVANNADNTVTPINTSRRRAGAPIPVGSEPDALAITPDGRFLYVANYGDNTVSQLQIKEARKR